MTEERLLEIEQRCKAATPGPWHAEDEEFVSDLGPCDYWLEPCVQIEKPNGERLTLGTLHAGCGAFEDADFIANARTDLPELIAKYRKLKAHAEALADAIAAQEGKRPVGPQCVNALISYRADFPERLPEARRK